MPMVCGGLEAQTHNTILASCHQMLPWCQHAMNVSKQWPDPFPLPKGPLINSGSHFSTVKFKVTLFFESKIDQSLSDFAKLWSRLWRKIQVPQSPYVTEVSKILYDRFLPLIWSWHKERLNVRLKQNGWHSNSKRWVLPCQADPRSSARGQPTCILSLLLSGRTAEQPGGWSRTRSCS